MYHHYHAFQGRKLTDQERARVLEFQDSIHYSPRYSDDNYEYRHVMLPKAMLKVIPSDYFNSEVGTLRILTEDEWRGLGITQSLGWEHYECHAPEPHILLFKRPLNYEAELRAATAAAQQPTATAATAATAATTTTATSNTIDFERYASSNPKSPSFDIL
ncbi:Cks1p [Saccharomyces cerevisiae FostersO]|nr:Cks1p [Saccharomyces cerevisiae FostersO]